MWSSMPRIVANFVMEDGEEKVLATYKTKSTVQHGSDMQMALLVLQN